MKNSLLSICSTNILVRLLTVNMKNCFTQKKSENVRPHSSNSIENRPHYSQSSRENATPSSGTSPLASYKEVPHKGIMALEQSGRHGWANLK